MRNLISSISRQIIERNLSTNLKDNISEQISIFLCVEIRYFTNYFVSIQLYCSSYYLDRQSEPPSIFLKQLRSVRELLASGRIQPVYLDELGEMEELSLGVGLMVLTTLEGEGATNAARGLIDRAQGQRDIIDLISTIIVYKFSNLSRDEVDAMLGIELQQTRVYQEARAEGKAEGESIGEARMVMRQLNRRFGDASNQFAERIQQLNVSQLEELGEALLDFTSLADLESWLS